MGTMKSGEFESPYSPKINGVVIPMTAVVDFTKKDPPKYLAKFFDEEQTLPDDLQIMSVSTVRELRERGQRVVNGRALGKVSNNGRGI
ncbi:hypothetical protein HYS91_03240 [Candidatus Daviesbacteria bacterium]|nr:hypothetical protein [Candidatus Daviesbacteria bacterium]